MELPNIALASASPRRFQLLRSLDLNVRLLEVNHEESIDRAWPTDQIPEELAKFKNRSVRDEITSEEILMTADTVVILDGTILHKPENSAEAIRILGQLSGRWHEVITGVCLFRQKEISFSVSTRVHMMELAPALVEYYVSKYQPMDKAGGYGIQEWLGWSHIDRIEGSYSNVMGLPTAQLFKALNTHFL